MTKASQLTENIAPASADRIVHRDISSSAGTQSKETTLENVARTGLPIATASLNGVLSAADKTLINNHLTVPSVAELVTGTDNEKLLTILRATKLLALMRVTTFTVADFSPNEYVLDSDDEGRYLRFNFSDPIPVTISNDAGGSWTDDVRIDIRQVGVGQVQIIPGSGVTLNNSITEGFGLRTQGSTVTLVRIAANEWDVIGDFEAEGGSPG